MVLIHLKEVQCDSVSAFRLLEDAVGIATSALRTKGSCLLYLQLNAHRVGHVADTQ